MTEPIPEQYSNPAPPNGESEPETVAAPPTVEPEAEDSDE
jgi:hypothetical protein